MKKTIHTTTISQTKEQVLLESYQMILLSILAAVIPFVFQKPQLLVGSIVNAMIAISFWRVKNIAKGIPILFLPSLAALSHNIIFGPFTFYLVYLLPFIWLGNTLYGFCIRRLYTTLHYLPTMIIASLLKSGLLFLVTIWMVNHSFLPKVFIVSMGIGQLTTAILGGLLAYIFVKIYKAIINYFFISGS